MTAIAITDEVAVINFPPVQTITGSVYVLNPFSASFALSASISIPPSVNQGSGSSVSPWFITTTGSLPVTSTPIASPGASVTVFTASVVNTAFLAPNVSRVNAVFTNDDGSAGNVYVKFGVGASTGSYSVKLRPGGYYELPCNYSGEIDGVWDTMIGTLFITEFST